MTLNYRGVRDNNRVGYGCKGKRYGEITYNEGEEDWFYYVIKELKRRWKVDDGVEFWACVEVADREEFEALKDDWTYLKKGYKY